MKGCLFPSQPSQPERATPAVEAALGVFRGLVTGRPQNEEPGIQSIDIGEGGGWVDRYLVGRIFHISSHSHVFPLGNRGGSKLAIFIGSRVWFFMPKKYTDSAAPKWAYEKPASHVPRMKECKTAKDQVFTPLKINMEHNHGGLEDHFPF